MLVLRAADLVMLEANQPYLDAVGKTAEELTGRYVFDVFPNSPTNAGSDQESDLRSLMMAAVGSRQPVTVRGFRYDIPRGDGFDVRWWNVVETPVLEDGEVVHILHCTEDVTDLHRARAQLTEAQAAQEVSAAGGRRLARDDQRLPGGGDPHEVRRAVLRQLAPGARVGPHRRFGAAARPRPTARPSTARWRRSATRPGAWPGPACRWRFRSAPSGRSWWAGTSPRSSPRRVSS